MTQKLSQISSIYQKQSFKGQELDLENLSKIDYHNGEDQWKKIPQLKFGFQSIVQNPGIYKLKNLKDKLSKEDYEHLKYIPQSEELNMKLLDNYTKPSKDNSLLEFALKHGCKYLMSTSTISSFLSQIFYNLSYYRNANYSNVPFHSTPDKTRYMNMLKKPSTNFFRCIDDKNDIWALDGDKGVFKYDHLILMDMGKILEYLYTLERNDFQKILLKNQNENDKNDFSQYDYHRLTVINNNICMRSQIDCWQQLENGEKIVYEIKTRALAPLRYDVLNYQKYLDYEIDSINGLMGTYERENYDLIRGAFLKYYFQLKIGGMDGAFIGYHNTKQNFGFEYVKRDQIEKILFGNSFKGELIFLIGSKLINQILEEFKSFFKNFTYDFMKIGYYSKQNSLIFFVELFKDEDYEKLQTLNLERQKDFLEVNFYYSKYNPNPEVFKFEVFLDYVTNGIQTQSLLYNVEENDNINIKYKFMSLGRPNFDDYMHFLLSAYKSQFFNFDDKYTGRNAYNRESISYQLIQKNWFSKIIFSYKQQIFQKLLFI